MRTRFTSVLRPAAAWLAMLASTVLAGPATNISKPEDARKLIAEAKCETCHMGKVGGDGSAIYLRKDRRVTSRNMLLPKVARCNNELGLGLFPEDEAAIAAYLNTAYYHFKG